MKIGRPKKKPGSLFGFLTVNYIAFTLLIVAIAAAGVMGTSLYLQRKAPFPDTDVFFREIEKAGDENFARLQVERYLGKGAGAFLFDESGHLLARAGANGEMPGAGERECIPEFESDARILAAELSVGQGRRGRLVTQIEYGEDGELLISGYALLDENLKKIGGGLFRDKEEFTETELRYLQGKNSRGDWIYSHRFTDGRGQKRRLIFFMPQRQIEDYIQAYEIVDRVKWLFLPAYAAAAFLCIRHFGKKAGKLLAPLNTAIRNYAMGLPSGLQTYEGPKEFEELAQNFVQMEGRLKESEEERRRLDEEKRRLLADISHDLKTPLTVIQGYADALRDGLVPEEEQAEYLKVISQRTRRVNELLLSFHEYSKLDHPQVPVRLRREDLCQAVQEYLAGRWGELELGGFSAAVQIPEEPVYCELDMALLCRALDNIVNNAMKYNLPGTCLSVRVEAENDKAFVYIGNNGREIPDELKGRLFQPFSTGDSARGGAHGSGLGLAISRRIAELHGGTLILADPPSSGLSVEFVFQFPRETFTNL